MNAAEISDVQLDRLLGQVLPPRAPTTDLADRIAARALRTPQVRPTVFPLSRRHGPRRRTAVWSALVAANVMVAAAAAASWDGQRFDFQRLADLPRRVVAAVRFRPHNEPRHSVHPSELQRVPSQITAANGPQSKAVAPKAVVHAPPAIIAPIVPIRPSSSAVFHVHGVARARFQRQGLAAKSLRSIIAGPRREAELRRRSLEKRELVDKREPVSAKARQNDAVSARAEARVVERTERNDALAERQQSRSEVSDHPKADENAAERPEAIARPAGRQASLERRWRSRSYRRMHVRERFGRFRGRF